MIKWGINAVACPVCDVAKMLNSLQKCEHCNDIICEGCGYCNCSYKSSREEKRQEKYRLEVIQNHKLFLADLNIAYSGISKPNQIKTDRTTHCYNCNQSLDNKVHLECLNCRFLNL